MKTFKAALYIFNEKLNKLLESFLDAFLEVRGDKIIILLTSGLLKMTIKK